MSGAKHFNRLTPAEAWTNFYKLACEFGRDINAYADAVAEVLDHDEAIRTALTRVTWLSQDDAETELWQAIQRIKIGNKTDDKLILEQLRAAGFWLARYGDKP